MEYLVPPLQTCSGNRRAGRKLCPGTAVDSQIDAKKDLDQKYCFKKSYIEKTFFGSIFFDFFISFVKDFPAKCNLRLAGKSLTNEIKKIEKYFSEKSFFNITFF